MQCTSIKPGVDCIFMSKSGCRYNGGQCHTIVDQCEGCQRVMELESGRYCFSFTEPRLKWNTGICPLATHVQREYKVSARKINPLKASKRRMSNRG